MIGRGMSEDGLSACDAARQTMSDSRLEIRLGQADKIDGHKCIVSLQKSSMSELADSVAVEGSYHHVSSYEQ